MRELTTRVRLAGVRRWPRVAVAICAGVLCGCGPTGSSGETGGAPAPPTTAAPAPVRMPTNSAGSAGADATAQAPKPATMMPAQPMTPTAMPPASGGGSGAGGSAGMPAAGGTGAGTPATGCDRPCLIAVLESYLTALTAKDPSKLMVTDDVRFTENGVELKLGEGLWQMASGVRDGTRLDFADPVQGQVGSQLVVETGSSAKGYSVRLKVVESRISEVKTCVPGNTEAPVNLMGFVPDPIFLQPIDPAKRPTRDELLKSAQAYEKMLETGSASMAGVKFHPEMVRLENGTETDNAASLSARERAGQGDLPSRYPIIDEEYGLVFAVYQFGTILVPSELFKIMDGEIRLLNIVINGQSTDGWD